MHNVKIVAWLVLMSVGLALSAGSGSLLARGGAPSIRSAKDKTLTFKAGRSHAGGLRYIPASLTFGDRGVSWQFEEEFERHVDFPWSALETWSCGGKDYGYKLTLEVEVPENGGGSFKLKRDDLMKAQDYLLAVAPE